jgi:hypothetical protein
MDRNSLEKLNDRLFRPLTTDEESRVIGGYTAIFTSRPTRVNGVVDTTIDIQTDA